MNKDKIARILKDSRLYSYFNYTYAKNDYWYIQYDKESDNFNNFKCELDNECYEIINRLYGKRSIDLKRLKDYVK